MQTEVIFYDGSTGQETGRETVEIPDTAPTEVNATVATIDTVALSAATTRAEKATTVAGLRAAVLDIAAAITPSA